MTNIYTMLIMQLPYSTLQASQKVLQILFSEPKSIIMTRPLCVMGKRKTRITLNKCCNKTFCLSKYSEYSEGPAAVLGVWGLPAGEGLVTDLRFTRRGTENLQSHPKRGGAGHRSSRGWVTATQKMTWPPSQEAPSHSQLSREHKAPDTHSVTLLNGADITQNCALV